MGHKGIRLLIEDVAKSLGDDIQFSYGRTSDINLDDKRYPFIALDPLSAVPQYTVNDVTNYQKRWNCQMAFYQQDKESSDQNEYAKILDEMSDLVDDFVNKLNFYSQKADSILVLSINQQPFVKIMKDSLTGYILTFQLQEEDNFDYCGLGC